MIGICWHSMLLNTYLPAEVDLQPYDKKGAITYRVTGGILDFFVFSGPSSGDVIQQYVGLVGLPFMPPFWSLGFHLCKHGYGNSSEFWKVIQRNRAARMPYVSFVIRTCSVPLYLLAGVMHLYCVLDLNEIGQFHNCKESLFRFILMIRIIVKHLI